MPSAARQAGVPEEVEFQTKPEIALEQIRQAMEAEVPVGVVLADAGYGNGTQFRTALTELGLQYVVGIESIDDGLGTWATTFAGASRENQVGVRRPNACSAMQIISPFR